MSNFFNTKLLDGYAISAAEGYTFTTLWIDIKFVQAYSFSFTFGGTPSGTLTLQYSNELPVADPWGNMSGTKSAQGPTALPGQPYYNGLDATTVATSSVSISAAGNTYIERSLPGARWVRAVYAATSGTATVTCNFNAHQL